MTPELSLRDYQEAGITDLVRRWDAGGTRIPEVLATGLGKTVMFSRLAGRWLDEWREKVDWSDSFIYRASLHETYGLGKRVLVIAHTDELIEQAAKKLRQMNPGKRVGIVKAELNEVHADIIVSSRQTLHSLARRVQIRNVGMIVIDECHHATRTNTYGQILEHFGAFNDVSPVKVVGFTATLARGDKEKLSEVWEPLSFSRDVLFGIRRGYLLDVRGKRVEVPDFDMGRVRQSGGDYRDTDIGEELERTFAPEIIAEKYAEHAAGRKGIAFWPLVETAEHGARAFNEAGIRSEVIHGKLGKLERRAMLQRLHTGETQVIHGVAVLTEGFDEPTVDVVVIARPTRSAPLYQQMVGRVLRPDLSLPSEQREKALILDVVGAGVKHDLRSLVDLSPKRIPSTMVDDEEFNDASLLELDDLWEQLLEEQHTGGGSFVLEGAEDYRGPVRVEEFDPLGRKQLWSKTPAGTWYMGAGGDAYVFLVDSLEGDPGTYDVVLCSKRPNYRPPEFWVRPTEHTGMALDMALGWAEAEAEELGGYGHKELTGRKSAWRKKAPSDAAKWRAGMEGVSVVPEWNAGQLSEAIDEAIAARTIDPLVAAAKEMSGA